MITWKLVLALALAGCGRSGGDQLQGARKDSATRQIWIEDPYAELAGSCGTRAEDAARSRLNGLRAAAGAGPLRCLEPLTRTARAHADYLVGHADEARATPHREKPGEAGYTGVTPGERAGAAGLDAAKFWLAEGVGGNAEADDAVAAARVVDVHVDTVYHRGPLLTPSGAYFALAPSGRLGPAVLMTLARVGTRAAAVTYPPDGATGIATSFDGKSESPEPPPSRVDASGGTGLRGYPVSIHAPQRLDPATGKEQPLGLSSFVLTRRDTGAAVAGLILDFERDPHLAASEAVFLPDAPLLPGVVYEARVEADAARARWSFRTSVAGMRRGT